MSVCCEEGPYGSTGFACNTQSTDCIRESVSTQRDEKSKVMSIFGVRNPLTAMAMAVAQESRNQSQERRVNRGRRSKKVKQKESGTCGCRRGYKEVVVTGKRGMKRGRPNGSGLVKE